MVLGGMEVCASRCPLNTKPGTHQEEYTQTTIFHCITQLKAQGLSRTCNESKEEEEEKIVPEVSRRNGRVCFLVYPETQIWKTLEGIHANHKI
jgi:hypothetical protein